MIYRVACVAGMAASSVLAQELPGHVRAVNAAAAPGGNGRTWETAFNTLQAGLDAAAASGGAVRELWLAQGEYSPASTPGNCTTFVASNVSLFGGFLGNETSVEQRPEGARSNLRAGIGCQAHHTLLSVTASQPVRVDGLDMNEANRCIVSTGPVTLSNVQAIGRVSAISMGGNGAPFTIRGCYFRRDGSLGSEGVSIHGPGLVEDSTVFGFHGFGAGLLLTNLTIRNSDVRAGGGGQGLGGTATNVHFEDCNVRGSSMSTGLEAEGCVFRRCTIGGYSETGGPVFVARASRIDGCVIDVQGKVAISRGVVVGSTIRADSWGPYTIALGDVPVWETVLEFRDNGGVTVSGARRIVNATFIGGGVVRGSPTPGPHFINCFFANSYGGASLQVQPGCRLTNCIIWPQQVGTAGVISAPAGMSGFINNSIVRGWTGQLGGFGNSGADPMLNPDGTLMAGSPAIDAGDTAALPSFTTLDLAGACRVVPGRPGGVRRVDLGPFERGCWANFDCSTTAPVLNVADLTVFLQRYAAGDARANCDDSTSVPFLTTADFACFVSRFAAGCP